MSDLISRQAVIDSLYDWSNHSMTDAETWHLRQVIGDIKSMPSVTPQEPRWIPVSERLPEDEQDCLITYEGMGKFHIKIATYSTNLCKVDKYNFHTKKDISGFYGYDGEWGYFEWSDVVAWMPLPKPYKESEDRNDDT